ncbi:hypothetical protein ACN267_32235 [Micromonospora sp. WMMD734]|uniref:hypothetical protein n=1 Tax=Micromonospora sp. WMMD734 TaxID=3404129 RepID=UPI003B94088B
MQPDYPHADYVRRLVDAAPPPTDALLIRLAALLRPAAQAVTRPAPVQRREAEAA